MLDPPADSGVPPASVPGCPDRERDPFTTQVRVLVVDDHQQVLKLMVDSLRKVGIQSVSTCSPEEGVLLLQAHYRTISVALVDYSLPDTICRKYINQLRELSPSLRVIVVSGFDLEDLREDWDLAEADAFLPKPFLPQQLLALVEAQMIVHRDRSH